jgi:hypothetical protein
LDASWATAITHAMVRRSEQDAIRPLVPLITKIYGENSRDILSIAFLSDLRQHLRLVTQTMLSGEIQWCTKRHNQHIKIII